MSTRTLVESDDGTCIPAKVGDVIEIHLAENPTTGYRWAFEEVGSGVRVERDEFHLSGTPLVPGAGGVHEWRLKTETAGHQTVRLRLWRDWEGESGVIRRFAVDFEVG